LYYHYTPPVLGDPVDPPPFRPIRPARTLGSLATFHVFDSENAGSHEQRARLAMGVGGCAG
jgi:hypothetical protein